MKRFGIILAIVLGLTVRAWSVAAPTNPKVGVLQPNSTVMLTWDEDLTVSQWSIYFNGLKRYTVGRGDITHPTALLNNYLMQTLPLGTNVVLTMTAKAGTVTSAASNSITFTTAAAPFSYSSALGRYVQDTFTTTGFGTIVSSSVPLKSYSIEVCGTDGSPNSWQVDVEGSLDGVSFTQFISHSSTDCSTQSSGANIFPALYFRAHCVALDLGAATNIVTRIVAIP